MLDFIKNKGNCTGCSACLASCPISCISMKYDAEGFWYPESSDACINCGKCERVCPLPKTEKTANHGEQKAYACITHDYNIWKRSASGGAFSEICMAWGDEKTIVVGAAWDGLNVHQVCIEGIHNIEMLCKSKYVASYPENTFKEIRDFLKQGRKVIFCGVPCQVAGLKSFLNSEYNNLLTVDLICHGVGSPYVFETAVDIIGKELGIDVISYEFRAKRRQFEFDYLTSVTSKSGEKVYLANDPYMQLFLQQKCLRPSCGKNCKFRIKNRQGDITIADFKGLKQLFPHLSGTKRNYSTLVTNSYKGNYIVTLMKNRMDFLTCEISDVSRFNPLFERQTVFSEDRDEFFDEYTNDKLGTITKQTNPVKKYKKTVKLRIFDMLPIFVRRFYVNSKK